LPTLASPRLAQPHAWAVAVVDEFDAGRFERLSHQL
jgi:hypothetical protein